MSLIMRMRAALYGSACRFLRISDHIGIILYEYQSEHQNIGKGQQSDEI